MIGILWLFLQSAASHLLYLALRLETGSFPKPLSAKEEQAAFAAMRAGDAAAQLRQLVTALPEREQQILTLRYGLNGAAPQTQQQIAAQFGISRSYVSRLEKHALARLRRAWNQPHPL